MGTSQHRLFCGWFAKRRAVWRLRVRGQDRRSPPKAVVFWRENGVILQPRGEKLRDINAERI